MSKSIESVFQAIRDAEAGNPSGVQDSIGVALGDKLGDAINLKKISVAGNLFNDNAENTEEEGTEEETNG